LGAAPSKATPARVNGKDYCQIERSKIPIILLGQFKHGFESFGLQCELFDAVPCSNYANFITAVKMLIQNPG
jgi:hypothetical protein